MTALTCAPSTIYAQSGTTCTLTLSESTSSATSIALKSNDPALTIESTLVVPSGNASATFRATAGTPANVNQTVAIITATLNTQTETTTVRVHTSAAVRSVTPLSIPLGVYTVSVNGSGFTPDSRVSVDGSPLATTFVSDTLLTGTGYTTESRAASLVISDGATTSAPVQIQAGVAQPRLSYSAAARFLQQASFGPQAESIMHLQQAGIQTWLDEQFTMQPVSSPDQPLVANAIQNPDQLRQRVVAALSQNVPASTQVFTDAFANYRQILAGTQAGQPAALDQIFNQPGTGTSVATQLIQSMVKANPSPAYVQRVAATFNDNGLAVRGDMRSVVSAVLLDPEARAGDIPGNDASNSGRVQQDTEFVPGLLRALGVSQAGGLATANLGADRSQVVASLVTSTDLSAFADLASSPESLADALDVTFLGGQMSSPLKQTLTAAIAAENGGNLSRAQMGVFLVATSSEYNVRH
jgi:hypothetical protein